MREGNPGKLAKELFPIMRAHSSSIVYFQLNVLSFESRYSQSSTRDEEVGSIKMGVKSKKHYLPISILQVGEVISRGAISGGGISGEIISDSLNRFHHERIIGYGS